MGGFSSGQLQWLFPPMEVSKLQHPTKSSLWRSDDGLISEKSKAEVYLGSMESKHTTWFTRKKRAKNKQFCLHFDRFWHWKPCYYYIYWTLFSVHCLCYIHIDTTSSACDLPFPSIDFYIARKIFELTNCENISLRELILFNLQIFLFRV